ncbi:ATP-binding cassette, subfamily C, bacterial [Rhizoctonia solani]|uniref:ATP-binding cassette, subfamily C, bacterial n=1 Tax=Rhizoctonia solani TaxID=456999 RepID=A0A0K6GBU9_9AGAM|nr:ATP-binding cassette, subfamily C, bacterial [Rhizoctonia solani]
MSLSKHEQYYGDSDAESTNSSSSQHSKSPNLDEISVGAKNKPKVPLRFHQKQLGVWMIYFPASDSWRYPITPFGFNASWKVPRIFHHVGLVWRFTSEAVSIGSTVFGLYFFSLMIASVMPSIQLHNDSRIMNLAEQIITDRVKRTQARKDFERFFGTYLATLIVGWTVRRLKAYSSLIVEQRVSHHFMKQILSAHCRLDISTAEESSVKSQLARATEQSSDAWSILQNLAEAISIISEVAGLVTTVRPLLASRDGTNFFTWGCLIHPFVSDLHNIWSYKRFYTIVTNPYWLRMKALFKLGTSSEYKKEIIGSGLGDYIQMQYVESMSALGDTCTKDPEAQIEERQLFGWEDFNAVFESVPLLLYAWSVIKDKDNFNLTSLVMMQQTISVMHSVTWNIVAKGKNTAKLFRDLTTLYGVLEAEPSFVDGRRSYPDDSHPEKKGMAVEFQGVSFKYSSTFKPVIKDMSFKIDSGQLCVTVGENGKSTTIGLITRLYDIDSGSILVDGRSVRDYKVSTLRRAANIMYQDYHHLPLTIRDNILLGRPECDDPEKEVEDAAKLGGAYDFVQKLPLKFDTNIEPMRTGFASWAGGGNHSDQYKSISDTEKPTKLSGGEWQRLALSRTFMKNSDDVRLLCYDEPSASLDPKAEYEIFERLRSLRGEKTMIFVTQ